MKDLISHFFLPMALQRQKRSLIKAVYKTCDNNIIYFICHIYNMVEYLKKFPPFGAGQRLPDNEILDMVELSLPKEWQKKLTVEGLDSSTQGLKELV